MSFNPQVWYQKAAATQSVFTSTWKTDNTSTGSSTATQVKLPLVSTGVYNFKVEWGDGSSDIITVWNQAQTTHTYSSIGVYQIKIIGQCQGFAFNNTGDRLKLLSIQRWGQLILGNTTLINGYFHGCSNLSLSSVADVLTITGYSTFTNAFNGCSAITTINRINEWNVTPITLMVGTFNACSNFNQSLSNWNMINVVNITSMFALASSFNGNITTWNVSNCVTFSNVFQGATIFNQNIGNWNVSAGNNFSSMFLNASAFNQQLNWSINGVNISNMFQNATSFNNGLASGVAGVFTMTVSSALTTMSSTFNGATAFNQDIGAFNTSNVTSLSGTFQGATMFNNGGSNSINSWNTAKVTTMLNTFRSSGFNQPIGSWITTLVTTTGNMFLTNTVFNQNIGSWDMGNCLNISNMFSGATAFNNGGSNTINTWNVSKVNDFGGCFQNAVSFTQPVYSWNVTAGTTFSAFMSGKTAADYSTTNLDLIYNTWTNSVLPVSININFGTIKHTAAASASRALLTRANVTQAITNVANNGSGLIRVTSAGHGRATGDKIFISGVLGTTEANGGWVITVIDANNFDLQGPTFVNTYTSGGTLRTGYGGTVIDGGI